MQFSRYKLETNLHLFHRINGSSTSPMGPQQLICSPGTLIRTANGILSTAGKGCSTKTGSRKTIEVGRKGEGVGQMAKACPQRCLDGTTVSCNAITSPCHSERPDAYFNVS